VKVLETSLPGVLIIEPRIFEDKRGFFMETYHHKRYTEAGIDSVYVQDNLSHSVRDILRGLHYQPKHPQAKLVQVIKGYNLIPEVFEKLLSPEGKALISPFRRFPSALLFMLDALCTLHQGSYAQTSD
jgi:hypothetical protein